MKIWNYPQGSELWLAVRRGRLTASQFHRIITAKGGKESKGRKGYIHELIAECFCPDWVKWLGNDYTDRGTELEPQARECFESMTGLKLKQEGFITMDGHDLIGYSPDSLVVGADGKPFAIFEAKCPIPKTHVEWYMEGELPAKHAAQVHGAMAVTDLNEAHFFSYYENLSPFHLVVKRSEYTERLKESLLSFEQEYLKAREEFIPKLQLKPTEPS